MPLAPSGMSVQQIYRLYAEGQFLVNRRYQRKLVWTVAEKQALIGSALQDYPIPLILLAERNDRAHAGKYEIIDGMQRLDAVVSFIENRYAIGDKYFDLTEFSRAKQRAEAGGFTAAGPNAKRLTKGECAQLLDYQFAVSIFVASAEEQITDVFRRINSYGRQLSPQERRQAGVTSKFSNLVRLLSSELRGDASKDVLDLAEMPEISIESKKQGLRYGVVAEETFWVKQQILTLKQIKDSEDEQVVADIVASILSGPIAASKELLDEIYTDGTSDSRRLEALLSAYGFDKLRNEVKSVFSTLVETLDRGSPSNTSLRALFRETGKSSSPSKTAFYALFFAFFDIIVKETRSPVDYAGITKAISGLAGKLTASTHYASVDDRVANINATKGLITNCFAKKDPPVLLHGAGLAIDFENSLRRSKIETSRYEFKQGVVSLGAKRDIDQALLLRLCETYTAIANSSPYSEGFLYVGVADKKADAERIKSLDGVEPIPVGEHFVVGIDRECQLLKKSLDQYTKLIINAIADSDISEPLKTQLVTNVDVVEYKGLSIIRIVVPPQRALSYCGKKVYSRSGSHTAEVEDAAAIVALAGQFQALKS